MPCPTRNLLWWVHGGDKSYKDPTVLVSNIDPLLEANIMAPWQELDLGFE
jgi:hypothetical protein